MYRRFGILFIIATLILALFSVLPKQALAACGTTNVALNKTATASSLQAAGYPASNAVDGSTTTRWSSAASDPQWLQVDLGSTQSICGVTIVWETAYAKSYQVQTSNDAATWTTIFTTTTGTGGTATLTGLSGSGRYIRMYGTVRATGYGYSIWEFQVYTGSSAATNTPSGPPTNTPIPSPTVMPTATSSSVPATPASEELHAGSDSSITINWTPSAGATSYNIYRGTTSGGEGNTPLVSTSGTTYKDANLSSTPIYFYQISAVNAFGESARTAEDASKTPPP